MLAGMRAVWLIPLSLLLAQSAAADAVLTGPAAYSGWRTAAPGVARHITVDSMPSPHASGSAHNAPSVIAGPPGARLRVPPGFAVQEFASGLEEPRTIAVAPNGDIFVAESGAGAVRVFRAADNAGRPTRTAVFA